MKKRKLKAISAFLGPETEFEGSLTFHGTVRIDGDFKGDISASGTVLVGENASVKATVQVSDAFVFGTVTGDITADGSIEILPTGKVFGDIRAPNVMIHPGAVFEGTCLTCKPSVPEDDAGIAAAADVRTG